MVGRVQKVPVPDATLAVKMTPRVAAQRTPLPTPAQIGIVVLVAERNVKVLRGTTLRNQIHDGTRS